MIFSGSENWLRKNMLAYTTTLLLLTISLFSFNVNRKSTFLYIVSLVDFRIYGREKFRFLATPLPPIRTVRGLLIGHDFQFFLN